MKLDFPAFAFIMTLAAVINGMGIVRLLASVVIVEYAGGRGIYLPALPVFA
jgi:Mor family transcriptional regulator